MAWIEFGLVLALSSMVDNPRGGVDGRAIGVGSSACELSVVWHDAYGLHPFRDAVRQEVARILGIAGVSACWQDQDDEGRPGADAEAAPTVRVILMPHDGSSWNLPERTLGVTVGTKAVRENVFVLFPNVVGILGYDSGKMSLAQRALLSRALGRVVVHELIHATLPDYPHAGVGVFQERLVPRLLTRSGAVIDPRTTRLLTSRLEAIGFSLRTVGVNTRTRRSSAPDFKSR